MADLTPEPALETERGAEEVSREHPEALRPWLRHRSTACARNNHADPCTCGLDDALARLAATPLSEGEDLATVLAFTECGVCGWRPGDDVDPGEWRCCAPLRSAVGRLVPSPPPGEPESEKP